jgi:hypothetical protein
LQNEPGKTLPPLLDSLSPGAHVLVVCPPIDAEIKAVGLGRTNKGSEGAQDAEEMVSAAQPRTIAPPGDVSFHGLIAQRCRETVELVTNHPSLELNDALSAPAGIWYTPVEAELLTKRVISGSGTG